jgi:putative flippase GtrA
MGKRLQEIKRFSFWGMINTLIGVLLIFLFQLATGNPYASNIAGFMAGGVVSYCIHARYTFRARRTRRGAGVFFLIVILCYIFNMITLRLLLPIMNVYLAQALAIMIYIMCSYVLQSRYAFPARSRLESPVFSEYDA